MNVDQFVEKYENKGLDWDGAYSTQCVDLARFYWANVCEISQPRSVSGAKDFWVSYGTDTNLNQNFQRISNTPDGVPNKGDVLIWGSEYGPWGHIAIFLKGDASSFTAFSQNDPIGTLSIKKQYKNYFGVLGWFRPNKDVNSGSNEPEGGNMDELLKKYNVNDINELDVKIYEHCGTTWGGETDGGFLGSARKRVSDLENEADRLRIDVNYLEEKIEDHECPTTSRVIEETLQVGDTTLIINGMTVDSEGYEEASYKVAER